MDESRIEHAALSVAEAMEHRGLVTMEWTWEEVVEAFEKLLTDHDRAKAEVDRLVALTANQAERLDSLARDRDLLRQRARAQR